jgi:hypothetical protein
VAAPSAAAAAATIGSRRTGLPGAGRGHRSARVGSSPHQRRAGAQRVVVCGWATSRGSSFREQLAEQAHHAMVVAGGGLDLNSTPAAAASRRHTSQSGEPPDQPRHAEVPGRGLALVDDDAGLAIARSRCGATD